MTGGGQYQINFIEEIAISPSNIYIAVLAQGQNYNGTQMRFLMRFNAIDGLNPMANAAPSYNIYEIKSYNFHLRDAGNIFFIYQYANQYTLLISID